MPPFVVGLTVYALTGSVKNVLNPTVPVGSIVFCSCEVCLIGSYKDKEPFLFSININPVPLVLVAIISDVEMTLASVGFNSNQMIYIHPKICKLCGANSDYFIYSIAQLRKLFCYLLSL